IGRATRRRISPDRLRLSPWRRSRPQSRPSDFFNALLEVRKALIDAGAHVTPVIDRDYFWAIYFRTPGGVLFEIATNEPGFDRDEDKNNLGEALKLPVQHAHLRPQLEQSLPPIVD